MTSLMEMLPKLLKGTNSGKLDWEELAPFNFISRFDDFMVQVSKERGISRLSLLDGNGRVVEAVGPSQATSTEWDKQLEELYALARRRALKADQLLSKLSSRLDGL